MAYLFTTFEYSVSHYSYISMSVSSSDCSYCYIKSREIRPSFVYFEHDSDHECSFRLLIVKY